MEPLYKSIATNDTGTREGTKILLTLPFLKEKTMNWHSRRLSALAQRVLIFSILGSTGLFAPGSAPQSIVNLTKDSEAIIIGAITQVAYANDTLTVTTRVERSIKGDLRQGSTHSVLWRNASRSRPHLVGPRSTRGLFFLKRDSGGLWTLLPAFTGYINDVRQLYYGFPVTSTAPASSNTLPTLDRVMAELLAAVEAGGLDPEGGIVDLPRIYRAAPSPAIRAMLVRFADHPSSELRMISLRALLAEGNVAALARVEREQVQLTSDFNGRTLVDDLAQQFANPDRAAIQILGRMATSETGTSPFREAAAKALARMHTKDSLPFLALLLDNASLPLKTFAVGGFAMFANNVPIGSHHPAPGDWPYRTDETIAHSAMSETAISTREAYYVGFWKSWWLQNRDQLAPAR